MYTISARARFVTAALLCLAGSGIRAAGLTAASEARVTPDPAVIVLAAGPSEPEAQAVLEAGLLFSGAAPARRDRALAAARAAMADASAMADAEPDPYRLGGALLQYLHDTWLRRYVESETTLDAAILDGRYNCVSASVAYLMLAKAAGLEAGGVVTKDHAFCYVMTGGGPVDVETTNRHGWDPGTKKEFLDSFGRVTGYSYVPPSDYARRSSVGARHLLALILWNRSTLLERASRWAEALALSADAYAYLGTDEARTHLADRAHNFAAEFINGRHWDEALDFLGRVEAAYGELGDLPKLALQASVGRLADGLGAMDPDEALSRIEEAWSAGLLEVEDRSAMRTYVLSRKAAGMAAERGWLYAWSMLEAESAAEPQSRDLKGLSLKARDNYIAETHNLFARLYNAGRYAEALSAIESALAVIPGENTFTRDADAARKALGR